MSYGGMSTGHFCTRKPSRTCYLKLESDELVDLVHLIVDGGGGVKTGDGDRRRIGTWFPSRRICGYGL